MAADQTRSHNITTFNSVAQRELRPIAMSSDTGTDPALEGEADLEPAGPSDPTLAIPPMPQPTPLYHSFDELFAALQSRGKHNGAAFVKESSSNPRDVDGSGTKAPTHYVILCDRSPSRTSRGSGL